MLYEIPLVDEQPKDIQAKYSDIIQKLKFPCPKCGSYWALSDDFNPEIRVF
jgi:hypothetical protein